MMQRLQRSGESRSGEGRSGRRRRSSSSSSASSSSGESSHSSSAGRSRSSSPSSARTREREEEYAGEAAPSYREAPRASLPPPRRALDPSTIPDRSSRLTDRAIAGPRRKWWLWVVVGLVLITALVLVGIRMLNRWRIEGEGFKVNAARRVSELAERKVTFSRFRQTAGDQLSNATLTLTPTHQDLLSSAVFSEMTADFSSGSWLADDWLIRSLRIRRADLAFQPGKVLDETTLWNTTPLPVDRGARTEGGFRLSMTSNPNAIVLESGRIDALNLSWPGPTGKPETLTELMGNFRHLNDTVQLELTNGVLDTSFWPPFPVRQLNAELRGTALKIVGARLGFTAEHEFRVTGVADLTPSGKVELNADITPVLLRHILPETWINTVNGSFESNNTQWISHIGQGPTASLTGSFRVRGLVLRGLPFVDKLANLLRKAELSILEFPNLTGDFAWTPQGTVLTNLSASGANDLLRMKGKISVITGESVSGDLTFEANEAFFAGLPDDSPNLFTPGPEGYRTLNVHFTGTDPALQDNIGIANPVIIQNRPIVIEKPRLTLPPGVVPPAPPAPSQPAAPGTTAPSTTPAPSRPASNPVPPTALRPVVPVPVPRPPSDAELERSFNEIIGR